MGLGMRIFSPNRSPGSSDPQERGPTAELSWKGKLGERGLQRSVWGTASHI